jgi:signal peptidase I
MPVSPAPSEQKFSLAAEALRSFGRLNLRVTGTSMLPALWPNDLLTIESVPSESLRTGDLALFSRDERFFVHRVIKKMAFAGKVLLITRGDAQPHADPPILGDGLLGRVVKVHRGNRVITPSRKWQRLLRLTGLALCQFDSVRGLALRCIARRVQSVQTRVAFGAVVSRGKQLVSPRNPGFGDYTI